MFEGMHDGWMWGMHWIGWSLWLLLIFGIVWALLRASQGSGSPSRESEEVQESPLEVLQRRYAEGELSTDEYEERKERLERDQ